MNHESHHHQRPTKVLGYVAWAVFAALIVGILMRIDNWKRDWTTNHARLKDTAADPLLRPVRIERSPRQVAQVIRDWVGGESLWSIVEEEEKDAGNVVEMHLTRRTPIFRFVDDIHVTISRDGDRSRVDATSQSRIGKGDLGQNPRNLKMLTAALRKKVC
jgi:uncharacterized protein (DUF1499 family)